MSRLTGSLLALLPLLLMLVAPAAAAPSPGPTVTVLPSAHYLPQPGDSLTFTETLTLGGGKGNYTGYWWEDAVNGTLSVTSVLSNGTDTASYDYVNHVWNSTGGSYVYPESGTFEFSATTYRYVKGTDNQTGENGTRVWFYMNNTDPVGAEFGQLSFPTGLTVSSRSADYDLNTGAGGFVSSIEAVSNGTYPLTYGFAASYAYREYFDPATGYVLGYLYVEHDYDSSGNGFVYMDNLRVTSTSFPLTAGATEKTYAVAVTQTGLPTSTAWAVVVDGLRYPGTGPTITVPALPNGTYAYLYTARGYTASPANGTFVVSGAATGVATSWATYPPAAPGVDPWVVLAVFVIILALIVLIVWLLVRRRRAAPGLPRHSAGGMPQFGPPPTAGGPPPISLQPGDQPRIQQVVVQEVVKVKCQYCGSLIDSTAPKCPFCGATRN